MRSAVSGYGEGSVFQRSDCKWVAKVCIGTDALGRAKVKQFTGKTEAIVYKKMKEYKSSTEFAMKKKPVLETVESYFTDWLVNSQYHKLKASSYDRLESTLENNVFPYIGREKLDKVTKDKVQRLINELYHKKKLSYSTVKKAYVALNAGYKCALSDDVIIKNPCVGVVLPSSAVGTKTVQSFTGEELSRFLTEVRRVKDDGEPWYYYGNALLLILNTGLRMGEALSLEWKDICFQKKTIKVSKNCILSKRRGADGKKEGGYLRTVNDSPKTAAGNRTIPMNQTVENALREMKKGNLSQYVIANSKGKPVLPSNFERAFHAVLKNAKIEQCGVHVLRHTFASMLFKKKVDIKIISKLLGHASTQITYDLYVHLLEQDYAGVTTVLDDC